MTPYPANAFSSSQECFEALVSKLTGAEAAQLDHGDLERLVDSNGRDLLRCLMADHLELRSEREKRARSSVRIGNSSGGGGHSGSNHPAPGQVHSGLRPPEAGLFVDK